MVEVLYNGPPSMEGSRSPFTREEHKMQQNGLANSGKRAPRRSQTQHEYFLPQPPSSAFTLYPTPLPSPPLEEPPKLPTEPAPQPPPTQSTQQPPPSGRRPPLGPPRRSYSVTDQQPIPRRHKPAVRLAFADLPGELHFAVFDFLDPIDSTCLGLTNKHFYAIHRRLHGSVPLTIRRGGPNELEWAWHQAGNVVRQNPPVVPVPVPDPKIDAAAITPTSPTSSEGGSFKGTGEKNANMLSNLRVRGQGYCRMCGVTRCQLHKHIQEWMGEGLEYCSVRQKFGPVAPEGSKSYCYMSKPGDQRRCGRHSAKKKTVEVKDEVKHQ
ncbi:uncharacterized protein C8A04DRAFT_13558 [Dichotomopilus funicola]|uniref:F-box domain-containing protein n=1 Tax=Dichotomopilus funicola TaxID=1934379 RepID=A0AAN6ZJY7_9PEZI|nr:hypothetical protein C8A04DRAFT_13558 [Dichotomopilus funicola]